jgi:hypothetical protein
VIVMEERSSGMKRVLCLRDGDSERGSGIQGDKGLNWRGTEEKRRLQGHNLIEEVRAFY